MLLISKIQLNPTNANLAMAFICKLSQSWLRGGQFAVFVTRVQYLAETLLRELRHGKTQ